MSWRDRQFLGAREIRNKTLDLETVPKMKNEEVRMKKHMGAKPTPYGAGAG